MVGLFAFSLWKSVPNGLAVSLQTRGEQALLADEYFLAENNFVGVLIREPQSTNAYLGLACSYYLSGKRSQATVELTIGLEAGLPPGHLDRCGRGEDLDKVFLAAKLGPNDTFAVPRVKGIASFEKFLVDEPTGTDFEESLRLLIGSCLAFRAGFDGAAWYYAADAAELYRLSDNERREFLGCLGPHVLTHLRCLKRPTLWGCVIRGGPNAAFAKVRPYVLPRTHPAIFTSPP